MTLLQNLAAAASHASEVSKLLALPWQPPYLHRHGESSVGLRHAIARNGLRSASDRRIPTTYCGMVPCLAGTPTTDTTGQANLGPAPHPTPMHWPSLAALPASVGCSRQRNGARQRKQGDTHRKGMHFLLAALKYHRGMAALQGPVTGGSPQ
jgi:hypothetical protein